MNVTEETDPAQVEKLVFKLFFWRPPEVLIELYFVAGKEGKLTTLKNAKTWLNGEERVDAMQVAAKRWKASKLPHDGKVICLRKWPESRGQHALFCRKVEDCNEGDEQSRQLNLLPDAWLK